MKAKNWLRHAYSMFLYRKSEEAENFPKAIIKREIRTIAHADEEFRNAIFELGVGILAEKIMREAG